MQTIQFIGDGSMPRDPIDPWSDGEVREVPDDIAALLKSLGQAGPPPEPVAEDADTAAEKPRKARR